MEGELSPLDSSGIHICVLAKRSSWLAVVHVVKFNSIGAAILFSCHHYIGTHYHSSRRLPSLTPPA